MQISKELLSKIKKIQIKTDRMASEILAGEYKSAFKGKGLNFDAIREYQFGDDIRSIDWKVTARMQNAFIRKYKEERQLTIMIILDLSASNNFGTQAQNKKEMSIELASVLASLAIKNNDKVGMILITDHMESYVAPKQGKAHIFKLIKDLLTYQPKSSKTDLKNSLKEAIKVIPRHSVVFLISDFLEDSGFTYEKELKILAKSQDLIAVSIRDPREFSLPNIGYIELVNPETGKKELMNLNSKKVRESFELHQKTHREQIKQNFKLLGVDFLDLFTSKPYINLLLNLFISRERRK
jgi:uncharacterized protein (DUF58 family)